MATILEKMNQFETQYTRSVISEGSTWRYYMLGSGDPLLWLTGGLRRAGLAFETMEKLAEQHLVIAPDYPPLMKIDQFIAGFDAILQQEKIVSFILAGQSYGGLLAQVYLAYAPAKVKQLVLSSTGPADYGKVWLLADYLAIALARVLPERKVKSMLTGGILKAISLPEPERNEWMEAINDILQNQLTRAEVISHFAVAADLIRKGIVNPSTFHNWAGRVIVMSAENDPTQDRSDIPRYEKLLGRKIEIINLRTMGHAALLFDPEKYCALLETALRG